MCEISVTRKITFHGCDLYDCPLSGACSPHLVLIKLMTQQQEKVGMRERISHPTCVRGA